MTDKHFVAASEETSPVVLNALKRSLELSDWISDHHLGGYAHKENIQIAIALYSIGLDHREAFLLLLTQQARTSAFALARSVFEAFIRGLWAETAMTDEEFETLKKRQAFPKFDSIVGRVNKANGDTKMVYGPLQKKIWSTLSDFSHGGFQQVVRWLSDDGIEPCHTDDEVVELLNVVDLYGFSCSWQLCILVGWPVDEYQSKATELLERFKNTSH